MAECIAIIHKDSDSSFGASFPDLPGCISAADTLEELRPMIEEMNKDWLDLHEHIDPITTLVQKEAGPPPTRG